MPSSQDPNWLRELFFRAAFVREMGIELTAVGEDYVETALNVSERMTQQDGFVHAGVLATLADHTGGGAGWTSCRRDQTVLSVEFKISMLRPAMGPRLTCRAEVVRAGKSIIFTEGKVWGGDGREVARLSQTLAVVPIGVGNR
ncbi:MAG: phenylacetic acid degradation protein PaaI [Deltaproteobacteria bacterium]|nr:MAG: phenylacetic acid degradation protein PaaI [Deltaproteobacteria bacterium]